MFAVREKKRRSGDSLKLQGTQKMWGDQKEWIVIIVIFVFSVNVQWANTKQNRDSHFQWSTVKLKQTKKLPTIIRR